MPMPERFEDLFWQRVEDNAFHPGAWWIGFSEDDVQNLSQRRKLAVQRSRLSKPKKKRLVSGCVSHNLPVRRTNKLLTQPKPAAQLWRRLVYRTSPALASECSFNFDKGRVLPERQQRYSGAL